MNFAQLSILELGSQDPPLFAGLPLICNLRKRSFPNTQGSQTKLCEQSNILTYKPDKTGAWKGQQANVSQNCESCDDDKNLFFHTKKSFLFSNKQPWIKKQNSACNVTMGSYNGAEICELVDL